MQELMQGNPSTVAQYAQLLAELHADLHACRIMSDLPSQHERLHAQITTPEVLPTATRTAALERLTRLSEDSTLCHGDFHPGNILMAERGPVIIDWVDAARGSAAADVARTWVLLMGHVAYRDTPSWVRSLARTCCQVYLRHYCGLRSVTQREVEAWIPIVAAARLTENIREARQWLLSLALQLTEGEEVR
jgi:Ser/Thr protein kinase RdoA (MazF antagonist)